MRIIAVRVHQLEQLVVQDLNQGSEVREVGIHGPTIREVGDHALHQVNETTVGQDFVLEDDEKWGHEVTHALHVALVQVLPHIGTHDVAQLLQVLFFHVEAVVAITALNVLLDPVQVQGEQVQQLRLTCAGDAEGDRHSSDTHTILMILRDWVEKEKEIEVRLTE